MDSIEIPAFVPDAVKAIAASFKRDPEIEKRLLTDCRMASVWRVLLRRDANNSALDEGPAYQRLRSWGISERDFSIREQACAAFYAFALRECSQKNKPTISVPEANAMAEVYLSAAKICRAMVTLPPGAPPEKARALEEAANYIEEHISWQRDHLLASPYVHGTQKSKKRDNRVPGVVRALASEAKRLFDGYLHQTVATVATVALKPRSQVQKRSVINWCKGLK